MWTPPNPKAKNLATVIAEAQQAFGEVTTVEFGVLDDATIGSVQKLLEGIRDQCQARVGRLQEMATAAAAKKRNGKFEPGIPADQVAELPLVGASTAGQGRSMSRADQAAHHAAMEKVGDDYCRILGVPPG